MGLEFRIDNLQLLNTILSYMSNSMNEKLSLYRPWRHGKKRREGNWVGALAWQQLKGDFWMIFRPKYFTKSELGKKKNLTFKCGILKSGPSYFGGDYPLLVITTFFLGRPCPHYGISSHHLNNRMVNEPQRTRAIQSLRSLSLETSKKMLIFILTPPQCLLNNLT